MLDTMEVTISNGLQSLYAFIMCKEKICYIDGLKYNVSDEFLDEIIRTISFWDNEYGENNRLDSEEFKVVIRENDKENVFHGKGIFPNNYAYFKELLGELRD